MTSAVKLRRRASCIGRLSRKGTRRRRRALIAFGISPLVALGVLRAAVVWWPYPSEAEAPPPSSTFVLDRNGTPLAALAARDGTWNVPLDDREISPHLIGAIVAVEDARFYEHHGVDWKAAIAAAWQDLRSMRVRRGASTLTMQVEHLREPAPRTFCHKIAQAIRACRIERRSTKLQILREYVNRAPFGGNLVGAGAASWRYFGKPCRELSVGEAALLAGLPQQPNRYRPDRFPERAKARRDHVLERMLLCGLISEAQRREAAAEPVSAAWRALPQDRPADDLPPADGALPALLALALGRSEPTVHTTFDAATQRQAARDARERLRQLAPSGVSAVAVVVLDTRSSQCLAAVSLTDDGNASRMDLCRCPRSTGSVIKPLIYAAAFEAGVCSPQTLLEDSPAAWPGYEPGNYDRQFRGTVTAAEALAQSRNIPAMLVLAKLGVEPAVGVLEAAGLRTLSRSPRRYGLSLAIGGAEATPLEIAEAYATLARGGAWEPVTLSLIRDPSDRDHAHRCISEDACRQTLAALSAPERTERDWPEAALTFVAWKTGTSSGHRDAWCAAVTPRRTVVVWLGNPGGAGSPVLVGQEAAAPLALQLISTLDPGPFSAWPAAAGRPGDSSQRILNDSSGITLISPAPNARFVITPDIGPEHQRILLKATVGRGAKPERRAVWWFVDDQPIARADADTPVWWSPTAGQHFLRAIDARGHAASSEIEVIAPCKK